MRIFARPLETIYNPGSRVATLVVSMGVMGFLGDLRGEKSKSPPNPLGLAERVHRPQTVKKDGGGSHDYGYSARWAWTNPVFTKNFQWQKCHWKRIKGGIIVYFTL